MSESRIETYLKALCNGDSCDIEPKSRIEAYLKALYDNGGGGGGGGGKSVQTDWDQTDATAADFLKNKPFGDAKVVMFEKQMVEFFEEEGLFGARIACSAEGKIGETIIVDINGEKSEFVIEDPYGVGLLLFGDYETYTPYCGAVDGNMVMIMSPTISGNVTVGIEKIGVTQIADKYVPIVSPLVIHFYNTIDGVIMCDKTRSEIITAYNKGIFVCADLGLLSDLYHGKVAFIEAPDTVNDSQEPATTFAVMPARADNSTLRFMQITLSDSGKVSVDSYKIDCTKETTE